MLSKKICAITMFSMFALNCLFGCSSGSGGGGGGNIDFDSSTSSNSQPSSEHTSHEYNPDVEVDSSDDGSYTNQTPNDNSDLHYLKFIDNDVELLNMVVTEKDTFESLEPFFPTLEQNCKEDEIKVWDLPEKVYEEEIKIQVVLSIIIKNV